MMGKRFAHVTDQGRFQRSQRDITGRIGDYRRLAEQMESAIARFARAAAGQAGEPRLLVGLSGGVDSAVVVTLAVRAVGPECVVPVTMPLWPGDTAVARARQVNARLGIEGLVVPIERIVRSEVATVNRVRRSGIGLRMAGGNEMDRMRVGNFASRARVAVLYDLARVLNGKVLGCGNRTEYVQGYAAKYGTPISYDFGVLDELYKADVYALARMLRLPKAVLAAVPGTGYYPGQTHEAELGASLEEQDVAAYVLFEQKLALSTAMRASGLSEEFLRTMLARWHASRHKRMLKQPRIRLGFIRGV